MFRKVRSSCNQCSIMLTLWLLSVCVTVAFAFRDPYLSGEETVGEGYADGRLILTPYIQSGRINEARKLALVPPLVGNVTSYSGYLTVNAKCQANMFFWLFPFQGHDPEAPVAVWLQGGPGCSSSYGLFNEIGPYELSPTNKVSVRKWPWTKAATYIFIDNPVGTGYSYTEKDECYAKNQVDVGRDLLNAVKQILKMFPEYAKKPFFLTGESYAGKYVPAFAYAIHKDKDTRQKINLAGLSIGNGLVDPVNQFVYSEYFYQLGLLDENQKLIMQKEEDRCKGLITKSKWRDAFECFDNLIVGDLATSPTMFKNLTGFSNYFHLLYENTQPEGNIDKYIIRKEVRASIHVGNATWHNSTKVEQILREDVMKSIRPWLEELLEHYPVLIYSGQLDLVVGFPLTENYLQKLNWSAAGIYKAAKRHFWWVNGELAGYVKTAGKLTVVLVRNAGHMVPRDKPQNGFDLITRFMKNKPFF